MSHEMEFPAARGQQQRKRADFIVQPEYRAGREGRRTKVSGQIGGDHTVERRKRAHQRPPVGTAAAGAVQHQQRFSLAALAKGQRWVRAIASRQASAHDRPHRADCACCPRRAGAPPDS
jgi:hypothetical protein